MDVETWSPEVSKSVEALWEIQGQHDELEEKFAEELAALESKYEKLYDSCYTKRFEIVNGIVEVDGVTDDTYEVKGIPDFWLMAMKRNKMLARKISKRDEEALKYLKDIKWYTINNSNSKDFKLEFHFDANPFFKNSLLMRTWINDRDDPQIETSTGTRIEWYPGKCLTKEVLKDEKKRKKKRRQRQTQKQQIQTEDCDSIFNIFKTPDNEAARVKDQGLAIKYLDAIFDLNIGATIGLGIVPRAVSWFTEELVDSNEYEDGKKVMISDKEGGGENIPGCWQQ